MLFFFFFFVEFLKNLSRDLSANGILRLICLEEPSSLERYSFLFAVQFQKIWFSWIWLFFFYFFCHQLARSLKLLGKISDREHLRVEVDQKCTWSSSITSSPPSKLKWYLFSLAKILWGRLWCCISSLDPSDVPCFYIFYWVRITWGTRFRKLEHPKV